VWIDLEIAAHFGQQIAPEFFLAVFQGGEFLTKVQSAVASFSLVSYERASGFHSLRQLS
jgi:hypothetical protein